MSDKYDLPTDLIMDRVGHVLTKHGVHAGAEIVVDLVSALLDAPIYTDFVLAVKQEATHQQKRWGVEHDAGKTNAEWFWLIGWLGGKAVHNPDTTPENATDKRLHRIIATAAACANWHAHILGKTNMRPGIEAP